MLVKPANDLREGILPNSVISTSPDVSILVPALNEEATIGEVINRLLALNVAQEVIVIDDGSDDRTPQILQSYGDKIRVITNPKRGGKGNAIKKGLTIAAGKIIVIQDADLEYVPEELPLLLAPIFAGDAKVVFGSRFFHGLHKDMALPNKLVNLMLRWEVGLLFGVKITDEATCYKAVDRLLMIQMNLECQRFEFCPEVTAKAIRMGQKILEVPITYKPRGKDAGKKIRWTDAPEAFWTLLKYRFWRADPESSSLPKL